MKNYFVYLTSDRHRGTIYTGMTNDLVFRIAQHKDGSIPGFTSRYHASHLVYYEETTDALAAIAREKQIKGLARTKKVALIESVNPHWEDLSEAWDGPAPAPASFAEVPPTERGRGHRSE